MFLTNIITSEIIKGSIFRKLKSYYIQLANAYKKRKEIKVKYRPLYLKYKDYSMVPEYQYIDNLRLAEHVLKIPGGIIECGTWRGGMIAGIAELLNKDDKNRQYYLFDSFEGLPTPKEIDGEAALRWEKDKNGPWYFDNCKAEVDFAFKAMQLSSISQCDYKVVKGWFSETLPNYKFTQPIALLRLDCDWYDSVMECLKSLYPLVTKDGIIILDDYYTWDGCAKAVHDYLSINKIADRIHETPEGTCFLIKS